MAHITKEGYPKWYDEECPHCKTGVLKGECPATLRQEIERLLRGEFICTRCYLRKDGERLDDPGF